MPIYDFECLSCGERFEALVRASERPVCPVCAASEPRRLFSSISGPLSTGLRGVAARRSDASRRVREEQRREGFAKKREEQKQRSGE